MTTAVATRNSTPEAYETAIVMGDLSKLSPDERITYYRRVCESLNLNPLTRPFDYLTLNGKLVLYARKDATEQLRKSQHVSIIGLDRETMGDLYVVTATARMPDGRTDSDFGATSIKGLAGDNLVNAMLKAVTKAKRRVTLSICGLGILDETEIETIPGATMVNVETGEVGDSAAPIRSKQRNEPGGSPAVVTQKTVDAIEARARQKGVTPDQMLTILETEFQIDSVWKLTPAWAKQLYADLGHMPDAISGESDDDLPGGA